MLFRPLQKEGRLNLKASKNKALIYFVACQPYRTTKAATRENIVHGFLEARYTDKKTLHYPDFYKIICTRRREPTLQEYNLCKSSFGDLMQHFSKKGHVTDDLFDKLGFLMDQDSTWQEG